MCNLLKYLSFDSLEGKPLNISDAQVAVLNRYKAKFNRADRLVLYPVTLALIINLLVVLYKIINLTPDTLDSSVKTIFLGECMFCIFFSLIVCMIRIAIFKYYLLHPVLAILPRNADEYVGIWMTAVAALFMVIAVVLNTVATALAISDSEGPALAATAADIFAYIICSLFYRFHVARYIQLLSEMPLPGAGEPI